MIRKLLPWAAVCAAGLACLTILDAQPQPAFPTPTVSPNMPPDVTIGGGVTTPESALPFFDDFSWREFIAVTWPAKTNSGPKFSRGIADASKKHGDVSVPTVFETLKADYELFLPNGAAPAKWDEYKTPSPCLGEGQVKPYETLLASFAHFHGFNQAGFGVEAGPLVAQNRTYVRYDTRMNQPEYDFILNPGAQAPGPLYLQTSLANLPKPLAFPNGSIDFKAAWRDMSGVPAAQKARYYVIKARALDPVTGKCSAGEFGLVGMHIVNKTAAFPRWVWSTFEHVDNVPAIASETTAGRAPWSLNDNDSANQKLAAPTKKIDECNPPAANPVPTQVIRLRRIHTSTQKTNALYQQALAGTVWANYQLTATQWPTTGADTFPNNTTPQPQTNTANTAAETWFQKTTASSCMSCHKLANQHDLVFFLSLNAFPAPSEPCKIVNGFVATQRLSATKKTLLESMGPAPAAAPLQPATIPDRDDTIRALQRFINQNQ
jgi:hypothetical protein